MRSWCRYSPSATSSMVLPSPPPLRLGPAAGAGEGCINVGWGPWSTAGVHCHVFSVTWFCWFGAERGACRAAGAAGATGVTRRPNNDGTCRAAGGLRAALRSRRCCRGVAHWSRAMEEAATARDGGTPDREAHRDTRNAVLWVRAECLYAWAVASNPCCHCTRQVMHQQRTL